MRSLLFSLIKAILFSAVILLVGQIPSGEGTIGSRFQAEVGKVFAQGGERLMQTKIMAGLANTSFVNQWLRNVYPPKPAAPVPEADDSKSGKVADAPVDAEVEAFSASDRESILRLLQ